MFSRTAWKTALRAIAAAAIGLFAASCAPERPDAAAGAGGGRKRLRIVCTIFPEYDWTRAVLGSHAADTDLALLLDGGTDLHSYQPTAGDIVKIGGCDLFIYVGGESSRWAGAALARSANPRRVVVNLVKELGKFLRTEISPEGAEIEKTDEECRSECDEHIWLSLKIAQFACREIAEGLCRLDSANAGDYRANAEAYCARLAALDARYAAVAASAKTRVLVFADRFPFRYLADDYGIKCYAAFSGCSAETEASFRTVAFLAGKVDELGLGCILTIEHPRHRIAQTVAANTKARDQKILALDSMQSVSAREIAAGATYLSIMESNLAVLSQALNARQSKCP